jgi:hypothetical protein
MIVYLVALCVLYIFYVTFESLGSLARFGGYKVGYISVGMSLQNQILSANRLLGFLIAPLVGFFADKGGTSNEIFLIGTLGSLAGGFSLLMVYFKWDSVSSFFSKVSSSIVEHGYGIKGFFRMVRFPGNKKSKKLAGMKINYFVAQALTTGLAMPSIFLLNIMAIKIPEYSSTLLQMATAISGFGNLILNFYTLPLLSVEESTKELDHVENSHRSVFLGKVFGMLILSPLVMCLQFLL